MGKTPPKYMPTPTEISAACEQLLLDRRLLKCKRRDGTFPRHQTRPDTQHWRVPVIHVDAELAAALDA